MKIQSYDVIVLGGGAAGLMAAFTAAKRDLSVLVIEKSNMVGKKILMSGGGHCNFTNGFVDYDDFISENVNFCRSAFSKYDLSLVSFDEQGDYNQKDAEGFIKFVANRSQ